MINLNPEVTTSTQEYIDKALRRLGTVYDPVSGDCKPLYGRVVQLRLGWEGTETPSRLTKEQRKRELRTEWRPWVVGEFEAKEVEKGDVEMGELEEGELEDLECF